MDIWFTRHDDVLWFSLAAHDEAPIRSPLPVRHGDVGAIIRRLVNDGYEIEQAGICPPDMLGLE